MRAALVLMLLPTVAAADLPDGGALRTPSGLTLRWLDTVHTAPGPFGLTYRFRFVAPDLAAHLPGWDDIGTGTDAEAPPEAGTSIATAEQTDDSPAPHIQLRVMGRGHDAGTQQPAPWQTDPITQDLHWLCRHYALPRIASPAPRPSQIVISITERPLPFGQFSSDTTQVFESFILPPDRADCLWETD